MIPGDIGDVPTLSSLNKPQKRALILRDQLRYLEPAHLDSYLDGVTSDEPPTYRNINGTVRPLLAQVTIKSDATRFDLGNIQFPEEGGMTYRAYLTVEDGRFEMRTEDALPKDDAELASISIHRFVAENMFPLFKVKYKAIHARMEKINEARRVAYNMLDHPPAKFEDGETVARLNPARSRAIEDASRDGSLRKRKDVVKHASNKRQRVGLETIPENVKSETFNAIPAQVKVNLFDNIIKTAFPNFDNLIVASWNVVSIYANVGSDFPELHKAVVELKGALEEFESAYAPPRTKSGKSRKEATPTQQKDNSVSRTSTSVKETKDSLVPAARPHVTAAIQKQEDDRYQEGEDTSQHQMPPPRIPQASHQQYPGDLKETSREPLNPASPHTHSLTRAQSVPQSASTPSRATTSPSYPNQPHPIPPRDRIHNIRDRSAPPPTPGPLQSPGSHLLRKRQEYTASLCKANRSSTGAALGQLGQTGGDEELLESEHEHEHAYERAYEQGRLEQGRPEQHRLGAGIASTANEVRSVNKMGGAPVAPMVHMRKDSGGRRGY